MLNRHDDVVRRFVETCQLGNVAALRAALDADPLAVCDSGGLVLRRAGRAIAVVVAAADVGVTGLWVVLNRGRAAGLASLSTGPATGVVRASRCQCASRS